MSTAPKTSGLWSPKGIEQKTRGDLQLRKDRMMAAVVLAIIAAVMILMIWLASLGGGVPAEYDYWMMP